MEKSDESPRPKRSRKGNAMAWVLRRMRACPPQSLPVGGRLSRFVEGWKHIKNYPYMEANIMNNPFILSIVTQGYRLRLTSPTLLRSSPWEIRSPWDRSKLKNARADIHDAAKTLQGFTSTCFWYSRRQEDGVLLSI